MALINHLISLLTTNLNVKNAAALIKRMKLDINEYPQVKERLMKVSMRFYLSRYLYKKAN
jgi:hypothetical protein